MTKSYFAEPVQIKFLNRHALVRNAREAAQMLFDVRWPKGGPKYQRAVEICLQMLDRRRGPAEDGKAAFMDAAEEAGILIERSQDDR